MLLMALNRGMLVVQHARLTFIIYLLLFIYLFTYLFIWLVMYSYNKSAHL